MTCVLICPIATWFLPWGSLSLPRLCRSQVRQTWTDVWNIQMITEKPFFTYHLSPCFTGGIHNHSGEKPNIATYHPWYIFETLRCTQDRLTWENLVLSMLICITKGSQVVSGPHIHSKILLHNNKLCVNRFPWFVYLGRFAGGWGDTACLCILRSKQCHISPQHVID